jgi:hypothetical protein
VQITTGLHQLGSPLCRCFKALLCESILFEHVLDGTESQWSWPHSGSSQACQPALFTVRIEYCGNAG